ncbi:MAG: hypothetical protein FWE11_06555 [Defluviitaleaceae bacterium]|nr:hypothetical protein [Defluviitaleaceae bacterium]
MKKRLFTAIIALIIIFIFLISPRGLGPIGGGTHPPPGGSEINDYNTLFPL